jgi:hypothetical protein
MKMSKEDLEEVSKRAGLPTEEVESIFKEVKPEMEIVNEPGLTSLLKKELQRRNTPSE